MPDKDDNRFKYVGADGTPDLAKLRADGFYPSDERIARGPVAVFECMQEIPCNPCEQACRQGYIHVGEDITGYPVVDEKCTGCGLCLPACPGLCVFILDGSYSPTEATVTMPYELQPLPEEGEIVDACDRTGQTLCEGRILKVRRMDKAEQCWSLTVAVPGEHIHAVRHVRRRDA